MKKTPEHALAQLAEWARAAPTDFETRASFVLTVHWLERRGYLDPDEYNGVMWCVIRGRTLISMRMDRGADAGVLAMLTGVPSEVRSLDPDDFEQLLRDILHTPPSD